MQLEGRGAMLTGAGRLGTVIAAELARAGARVGVVDVNGDAAAKVANVARSNGAPRPTRARAHVSQSAEVESAVESLERELGPLDILVNAHGMFPNRPRLEMDEDEWDGVFAVNTRGTMLTCRGLARRWVDRGQAGAIVNMPSGAVTSARAGGSHYTGSKAAVNMLTHVLAIELGPHRIRVNAIAPGLNLDDVLKEGDSHNSKHVEMMLAMTPLRRTGAPEDIAPAVVFLASDASGWTTGAIFEITGGSDAGERTYRLAATSADG